MRKSIRKGALIDLLLVNRESLLSEVEIGGLFGNSDYEILKYKISGDRRKTATKISTLDLKKQISDFSMNLIVASPEN